MLIHGDETMQITKKDEDKITINWKEDNWNNVRANEDWGRFMKQGKAKKYLNQSEYDGMSTYIEIRSRYRI